MIYPLVILGGGLSGLAAAIRYARFGQSTLILEKHTRPGGLNSYYQRQGFLLETGLHAMTNFAPVGEKKAPLNRLFRQLKLSRKRFITHEQLCSEVIFPERCLKFSNDINLLTQEIAVAFPQAVDGFRQLTAEVRGYDPFTPKPWISARGRLRELIVDAELVDMLLCPLMIYGNADEHDMDFSQFVIMFHAVFLEGFFRPDGTIKDLLDMLVRHYTELGGEIRYKAEVEKLITKGDKVCTVILSDGEEISCENVISTIGAPATKDILPDSLADERSSYIGKMSFIESIYMIPRQQAESLTQGRTCIFFSKDQQYQYCRPDSLINSNAGVINFPDNFCDMPQNDVIQIRITNPANYELWDIARKGSSEKDGLRHYKQLKKEMARQSLATACEIVGNFAENILYQDTFTPITIERFTGKAQGAVYGSPLKVKDGLTQYANLFVAGTDQGYLGIVGAMLSGVTMVNQHLLR